MIESAKIRSLANEIDSYRKALYIFKAAKNKLPGDINNDGIIGRHYRGTSKISDEPSSDTFSGEYAGINITWRSGPFVDLFTEGLIDFKPYNVSSDYGPAGKNMPRSNAFKNMVFNGFYTYIDRTTSDINDFEYKMPNGIFFWITTNGGAMNPKIVEKIDKKIDDGSYVEGNFRFSCDNKDYDYAIENKIECIQGIVKLIDI